jgi:hypothetical protein
MKAKHILLLIAAALLFAVRNDESPRFNDVESQFASRGF